MNRRFSTWSLFLAYVWLQGCTGPLDRAEYIHWVRDYDNGLHVSKQVGEYIFDVQYQPAQYTRLQEMSTGSYRETGAKDSNTMQEGIQYYLLTVGLADENIDFIDYRIRDIEEKQRKLYYFSYRFQYDITLEEGGEESPCVLYHFERPVDLKRSRTVLLGFEQRTSDATEATLKIASDYFGALPVRIKISKANIPEVKL